MHDPQVTYRSIFGIDQDPPQWKSAFEEANAGLPSGLAEAFERAWQNAQSLPLPHVKAEKWRWLDFSQLRLADARVCTRPALKLDVASQPDEGELPGACAIPRGLIITTLSEAIEQHPDLVARLLEHANKHSPEKFQALTGALAREGLFVYVPKGVKAGKTLTAALRSAIEPGMSLSRAIIWLESGAELDLVASWHGETHGKDPSFHLARTDLILEEDSHLRFTDLATFNQEVAPLRYNTAELSRGAKLDWIYAAVSTSLGKHSLEVNLVGEGAEAEVSGIYFPASGQKISVDTVQNHLAPRTRSNLLFRGAAVGDGEAIWRGMIYVDPIAQKSNGYQLDQNLMLGEKADIKSIPGLEICADDVSCSHGATVGSIDATELFYLQTRGIPLAEAERLIVEGFFAEIIEQIPDEETRSRLGERLSKKFAEK